MDEKTSNKERSNGRGARDKAVSLPFDRSVGYQVRLTHRLIQRYLQQKIEPYGVTLGMWYFLRALWETDGLTQSELSTKVGTMEPTTLTAIKAMERGGIVERVRNEHDRRKINVYLTDRGRDLEKELLPLAKEVVDAAVQDFAPDDLDTLLRLLNTIQGNLVPRIDGKADTSADATGRG